MEKKQPTNYDYFKKNSNRISINKNVYKFFFGLNQFSNIDKKKHYILTPVLQYAKYAAVAVILIIPVLFLLYKPINNFYINNKFNKLIYNEFIKQNDYAIQPATYANDCENDNLDYLEISLDLSTNNN